MVREVSPERIGFVTLLLEPATVVNNTPLWTVSSDPSDPLPLSSATLLTLHEHPNAAPRDTFIESDFDSYGPRRHLRVQYPAGIQLFVFLLRVRDSCFELAAPSRWWFGVGSCDPTPSVATFTMEIVEVAVFSLYSLATHIN